MRIDSTNFKILLQPYGKVIGAAALFNSDERKLDAVTQPRTEDARRAAATHLLRRFALDEAGFDACLDSVPGDAFDAAFPSWPTKVWCVSVKYPGNQ